MIEDLELQEINSVIEINIGAFWPQKDGAFFHEDNYKVALSNYFLIKGIRPYPEFSIPYGRIDLLGVNLANNNIYLCEFKHCYISVLDKILNDFRRLSSPATIDEIEKRKETKFNSKTIMFVGGGMCDTKLLFESAESKDKKVQAIEYMKKCNIAECEHQLEELHKYLTAKDSRLKIFYSESGINKYWTVYWVQDLIQSL